MENSFFEYRDKTGVESDTDSEIIDDSYVEKSFKASKKILKKNETVFVAESDESDDESEEYESDSNVSSPNVKKSTIRDSNIINSVNDKSRSSSIRRQSESSNKEVIDSSDEGEASPELIPRRRPPARQKSTESSDTSFIGRRVKKRVMRLESDTENSIIIEHEKHKKMTCIKATPLKIVNSPLRIGNDSDLGDDDDDDGDNDDKSDGDMMNGDDKVSEEGDSDGEYINEDEMVMSRATRMSILGVIPKDNDSDDSDYIQSDNSAANSIQASINSCSTNSLNEIPDTSLPVTQHKDQEYHNGKEDQEDPGEVEEINSDTSRLTCSPFGSPVQNVSIEHDCPKQNSPKVLGNKNQNLRVSTMDKQLKEKRSIAEANKENFDDDDVKIIDSKPEIIALSSDDDDFNDVKDIKKSPRKSSSKKTPSVKKSPSTRTSVISSDSLYDTIVPQPSRDNTIKQYLVPPSYPNQVVYVKKNVKENEMSKLNALKEDLHNVRHLLENMELDILPDKGAKLMDRLTRLESDTRAQENKVANMMVEPDKPTAKDIAKDGFEDGLSWEEIQKGSNAVQPRMFGKQAMTTHMAERNVILSRLRDLHESLGSRPAEGAQAAAPARLRSGLMPHQLHALAWLVWRETQRPPGGILADDMGLGKTITMIALIAADLENKIDDDDEENDEDAKANSKLPRGGTLVVCPASLIQQWEEEVNKHCTSHALSVCLHHGAARAAQPHRLAHYNMVVTTYNLLLRDHEKNGVLMRIRWRRVILDEAHIVRNYKSATSASVCGLKARKRWCLTGTPVQNKDLDLFALLKFLRCTPFDELTMWKKWIDNKSLGGQERLSTVMRCILLRRTKQQLAERGQLVGLPPRKLHHREVALSKNEMNVYQKVLVFSKTLFAQFLHQRAEKQADAIGFVSSGKDSEYHKMHKKMIALQGAKPVKSHEILVLLLRLRQVCCHCGLIAAMLDEDSAVADEEQDGKDLLAELNKLSLEESGSRRKSGKSQEDDQEEPEEEGTSVTEAIRSVLSPHNPVFDLQRHSSKIQAVMDCLEENVFSKGQEKAVVVSQWTSVLRLVERALAARGVRCVTLSGAVPVPARAGLVRALNEPASAVRVMLLSLTAGGVGLNLCGANHLLLLDPHWNPQLEQQAQDRIYRVGQTKPVHIYRFMCLDTVEQTIKKLQDAKLELAENVMTGARHNNASKLSIEDLKMLFNMGQG